MLAIVLPAHAYRRRYPGCPPHEGRPPSPPAGPSARLCGVTPDPQPSAPRERAALPLMRPSISRPRISAVIRRANPAWTRSRLAGPAPMRLGAASIEYSNAPRPSWDRPCRPRWLLIFVLLSMSTSAGSPTPESSCAPAVSLLVGGLCCLVDGLPLRSAGVASIAPRLALRPPKPA